MEMVVPFLLAIDRYINDETPDFWEFYRWFQDAYFGDQSKRCSDLTFQF